MNKETKRKISSVQFPLINHAAAGIDVSDNEMVVAFMHGDQTRIHTFATFTRDLKELIACLKENQIKSVAMESTGVYWVQLFLMLQQSGFDVCLVNARMVKNVTGKKTDEADAAWIMRLHSCGLLSASFQPDEQTRVLRSYCRHRRTLIEDRSSYLNRIQKCLEMMNIKLHTVISDIDGKSGRQIIESVIGGERDAQRLAGLCDHRIKAERETIVKSLEGNWREEELFQLAQLYHLLKCHDSQISKCDRKIEAQLKKMAKAADRDRPAKAKKPAEVQPAAEPQKTKKRIPKNGLPFFMAPYLEKILGVDVTQIEGIGDTAALTLLSEVGPDMSRWPGSKQFCAWLNVAPNTKISGGKVLSSHVPRRRQTAGQTFRTSCVTLRSHKGALGDFYRKKRSRHGGNYAAVATANKMATIYYNMVKNKTAYDPTLLHKSQEREREKKIAYHKSQIDKLQAA